MTCPTILEPAELQLIADTTTIYDAMCECGRHTITLDEPVCCQRCGSKRFSIARVGAETYQK